MSNATTMEKWFNFLGKVLEDEGLKNLPDRIYNCDETGWSGKEAGKAKVVGRKGGHTFKQKMGVSSHITAHLCVCADGRFLPTMLIFQGSLPHREFKDGLPSSWLYASSESGYMDGDLFLAWFKSCFLKYCTKERPVCLIMDNHDSHITLPLVKAAKENNVILIGLPGHTTHILQPLNVKIIGPLKSRCATIAERCGFVNNSFNISKARFPLILNYAIDQTTPSSVKEAFRATGICPLDGSAIDKSQIVPATFAKPTTATEENNDDNDARTCPTCGAFAANPLVQQGLVPQHLADVLMPTPSQPLSSQKKKRVVAEGRVISGDEILHKLKDEKENKKKEINIMKKKSGDVQGTLKLKKHIVSGQKSSAEKAVITRDKGLASVIYTCGVCDVRGRKDDEVNRIEWVGCDEEMCLSWFHLDCLSESEREYVRESLADDTDWYCKMCKPWLYEEE
ncbi:uncharacterized protein LOC128549782 [Mercenaria mercenaria]|uniref:uncharacterized protein LOC128549782 n=1 Tax=Mercenaria mercenaria TaxID=6596 RepID=UPI00234EDA6F|nr:uncharacterized protein LOC128549782 [Mercenaria mercenaria]